MDEPYRVLLVDDDPGYLEPMGKRLRGRGFLVETACSGPEAVELARESEGAYDVALVDESMGPPSGTEIMLMLRERHPAMQVILVTAWEMVEPGRKAVELGAYRFMSKLSTSNLDELTLNIELAARRSRERQVWEGLAQAGRRLSGATSQQDLYCRIHEEARAVCPNLDALTIALWDELDEMVNFVYAVGTERPLPLDQEAPYRGTGAPSGRSRPRSYPRKAHRGITEYAILHKRPLLLPRGDIDFRRECNLEGPLFAGHSTSEMVALMFHGDRVVGTIQALTRHADTRYTLEQLAIFQAFANQAAVAIQNLGQIEESRMLQEAVARLTGWSSTGDVLQAIVIAASDLIDCDFTGLNLLGKDGRLFKAPVVIPDDKFAEFAEPRQEGGLTRWVVEHRQPYVVADVLVDPMVKQSVRDRGIRSLLAMPLVYGDQVLGVLYAHRYQVHRFAEHEINLWQTYAAQAAMALHASMEREEDIRRAQRLAEALGTLTEPMGLKEAMLRVANAARAVFQADTCRLAYVDPATGEIRDWVWASDLPPEWCCEETPRPQGVTRTVIREGRWLFREDAGGQQEPVAVPALLERGLRSYAAGPLQHRGHTLAVVHVNYFGQQRRFGPQDEWLLRAFAAPAAAALYGALEGERLNRRLSALLDIFNAIRGDPDRDALLNSIAEHVRIVMDADVCSVLTAYDPVSGHFSERGVAGLSQQDSFDALTMQELQGWFPQLSASAFVADALADERLRHSRFVQREGVRAIMVRLLSADGEDAPLGVLFADHRVPREYDAAERETFDLFGDLIGLMLHETHLRRQLEKTRARLMRQTALVWISMVEATWRHALIQKAGAIRLDAANLLRKLSRVRTGDHAEWEEIVREIDRLAGEIADAPPRVPQSWEMASEPVPLGPLLAQMARWQDQHRAPDTPPVRVVAEVAALQDAQVLGYRRWLVTALEALIQNARMAMPPDGGSIILEGRRMNDIAEVRVIDTGQGVPPHLQERLFKQLIPSQGKRAGMGLGSSLAATIIEAHDGSIALENPGPGHTTVLIRLPIAKEDS